MFDDSSADGRSQREYDPILVQIGEPEFEAVLPSPSSNRGGSKAGWHEIRKAGQFAVKAGIDWHEGYIWGHLADRESYVQVLHELRRSSGAEQADVPWHIAGLAGLANCKPIQRGVPTDYQFHSGCGGVFLGLMDPPPVGDGGPICKWQFKGQFCSPRTLDQLVALVVEIASALSVSEDRRELRLSRLDLKIDVLGLDVNEVHRMVNADSVVCRARRWKPINDGMGSDQTTPTIYFGANGAPCRLRVYDKRKELRATGNEEKAKKYWHENPEFHGLEKGPITRFEFELKRDKLVEPRLACHDAKNMAWSLANAVHYLASEWFRIVDPLSHSRKKNCSEAEWWSELRDAWIETYLSTESSEEPDVYKPELDVEAFWRQWMGLTALLHGNSDYEKIRETLEEGYERMRVCGPQIEAKVKKHRLKALARKAA